MLQPARDALLADLAAAARDERGAREAEERARRARRQATSVQAVALAKLRDLGTPLRDAAIAIAKALGLPLVGDTLLPLEDCLRQRLCRARRAGVTAGHKQVVAEVARTSTGSPRKETTPMIRKRIVRETTDEFADDEDEEGEEDEGEDETSGSRPKAPRARRR